MSQIISDSLYLIGLHQNESINISINRLTYLLYLLEGYRMNIYKKDYLYDELFYLDMQGIYSKEIKERFKDFEFSDSIMINDVELDIGDKISKERKNDIYFIFEYFKDYSDLRLRQFVINDDSPAGRIYKSPMLLSSYMKNSIGLSKGQTKEWFFNCFN